MIFLDHAATAPIDSRVKAQLDEDLARPWNASSVHQHGQSARTALDEAREEFAALLSLPPSQVIFTSSASESNNLAIRGMRGAAAGTVRIASSRVEHSCVRETLTRLSLRGDIIVDLLPVGTDGRVRLERIDPHPDLLCLMMAQNETGVLQDLEAARAFCQRTGSRWLCDATQAAGLMKIDARAIGADFYSLSSHKIYGPPGVGALAGRGVTVLEPQITGGPQENERRAGTQPVPLIRGFVLALRLAQQELEQRRAHLSQLADRFLALLSESGVPFRLNGGESPRLPGFINISIEGYTGADLVIAMDARGYSVSAGSACSTGVMELSPALEAMYPADPARAEGALRITPGKDTPLEAMEGAARALADIVARRKRK